MSLATTPRRETVTKDGDEAMSVPSLSALPLLPHLIWRRVIYYLSDSLPTLLSISSLHPDFQDICGPHTSSFSQTLSKPGYKPIPPVSSNCYYYSLVQLVLEGHIDPSYIYEIYLPNQPYGARSPARGPFLQNTAERLQLCSYDRLLRQAVHKSPWIPEDFESEVCTRFQNGDPDAALVILLPLCTRLKMLELPGCSELCTARFQRVTHEYQQRGIIAEDARQIAMSAALRDRSGRPWRRQADGSKGSTDEALPFAELLILYVGADFDFGDTFRLPTMTPFMSIPSLYRIVLTGVVDETFPGWPAGDVRPSCPQIYFQQSSVSKPAVLAFAEGMKPPCEIRQWYQRPESRSSEFSHGADWDRVLVKRDMRGSKVIEMRFDFRGGVPGHDHAWVSWLWHGKMIDWRRFDEEEFSLEDGDVEEDFLSGSLGF